MSFGIYLFLIDGIKIGRAEKYYEKKKAKGCCGRCRHRIFLLYQKVDFGVNIEKFKIALGLCQVLSSFRNTYDIEWPPEVVEFFKNFAIFENLDIFKLIAMDCLYRTDYLFSLKVVTLTPLVMCVILMCLWKRGQNVYRHKLALYPRTCTQCHHPLNPYDISPKELAIRQKFKDHFCKLCLHHIYTYFFGGRYVF